MLHKEFWGLLFLGFVVWIFMAGDGVLRIERGCRPVAWAGNIVVSVTALVLPSQQSTVKRWVDKTEYGCRYTAWRLFYQDDYNRAMQQEQAAPGSPSTSIVQDPVDPAASAVPDESATPTADQ
jgi:hypothetical protein